MTLIFMLGIFFLQFYGGKICTKEDIKPKMYLQKRLENKHSHIWTHCIVFGHYLKFILMLNFFFFIVRDLNTLIVVIKVLESANHINYVNFNLKKIIFTKKP